MKRIISALLIFAMVFATSSLVSANDTTGAVTVLTSYNGSSPGATSGAIRYDSTSTVQKSISLSSNGSGSVTSVDENNDGTYDYINNSHTFLRSNYKTSLLECVENTPVFSFKYDIKLDDANVDAKRSFKPTISASASKSTDPTNITIDYANKVFSINNTKAGFVSFESETVNYEPGTWVTVEFRAYRGNDGKLICGAYVGDAQIFYGVGDMDYLSGFALFMFDFTQAANVSTFMDNIIISMMGESYKPTTIPEEVPDVPEVPDEPETPEIVAKNITKFDGSLLKDNKGTPFEETPIKPESGNISMYPVDGCIHEKQFLIRKGSNYGYGTGVTNAVEDNNTYYVINWSDVQSNYRYNVKQHMTSETPVLSYSYDIRIPVENSDKWRTQRISFSSKDSASENSSMIVIEYDGEKFIVNAESGLEKINSTPISYEIGEWIKFDIRAYLTSENKIVVGVYADDTQVYYGEGTSDYTSGFNIYTLGLISETETVGESTVTFDTHYDNIDVSVLPVEYMPKKSLDLSLVNDAVNSKVEGKAIVNANYLSLCLVTAVYNTSGSLEKLWVDTTVEDGILSNIITGTDYTTYVKSGYKVKTFIFDSLTSAIPQMEHKEITID